jgi:hypothetical protein
LGATRCAYLHEWRTSGLSDHSGIEADFGFDTTLRAAHTEIRR